MACQRGPSGFDVLPLAATALAGLLCVAVLGFLVLLDLTFEGPGDGSF